MLRSGLCSTLAYCPGEQNPADPPSRAPGGNAVLLPCADVPARIARSERRVRCMAASALMAATAFL